MIIMFNQKFFFHHTTGKLHASLISAKLFRSVASLLATNSKASEILYFQYEPHIMQIGNNIVNAEILVSKHYMQNFVDRFIYSDTA